MEKVTKLLIGALFCVVVFSLALWVVSLYVTVSLDVLASGLIAGLVAPVFVVYLQHFKDERFSLILLYASRNALFPLILALPFLSGYIITGAGPPVFSGSLLLALWFVTIAIYWLSVIYYYKR
jgi:hypothetical protein